jgi:hypothetical protein
VAEDLARDIDGCDEATHQIDLRMEANGVTPIPAVVTGRSVMVISKASSIAPTADQQDYLELGEILRGSPESSARSGNVKSND